MNRPRKIVIVDDHPLFREGMKLLLEKEKIGEVVAQAENGAEFLSLLPSVDPDLVLMDIDMPVMNGLEATLKGRKMKPGLKILVITMADGMEHCAEMISAGAVGFVHKTADKKTLKKAIETIAAGNNYYSMDILRTLANTPEVREPSIQKSTDPNLDLSDRELEVLKYFCLGLSVSEIADKIFRSVKTVEAHRSRLLEKTNTKNTINLVLFAIKNKLVKI
ncbi:MAG TPA: response regulator transcription factor [Bacteroidales bacterium]|nr:response regulator transcription factor [Bacteroidales bacterium]